MDDEESHVIHDTVLYWLRQQLPHLFNKIGGIGGIEGQARQDLLNAICAKTLRYSERLLIREVSRK